jgi:hypothetical protein
LGVLLGFLRRKINKNMGNGEISEPLFRVRARKKQKNAAERQKKSSEPHGSLPLQQKYVLFAMDY